MDSMTELLGNVVDAYYGAARPYEYNVKSIIETVKLNVETFSPMHLKLLFFDPNSANDFSDKIKNEVKKEEMKVLVNGFTTDTPIEKTFQQIQTFEQDGY